MATRFDTLSAAQYLKEAGADERLADAVARVIDSATSDGEIATKADLRELEARTKSWMTGRLLWMTLASIGTTTALIGILLAVIANVLLDAIRSAG